jgi:hypothetical protein
VTRAGGVRRRVLRTALAASASAVLLLTAACTGDSDPEGEASATGDRADASDPDDPDDPDSGGAEGEDGGPRAGDCHLLGVRAATSPTAGGEPVDCAEEHTALTIHVGSLATLIGDTAYSVDSPPVQEELAERCPRQLARFVGGNEEDRRLSRIQAVWFSPTLEDYEAGADWFRCDLVAFGNGDRLMRLPDDVRLRGVLDRPAGQRVFGLCGTARPGADDFRRVNCGRSHSWVAISTIDLDGGRQYPGQDEVREAGEDECADQARDRAGDDAEEFSYGWEWPTRGQWEAGQRYGYCWAPA